MDALDVPSYMKGLAEKLGLPYPTLAEWKASKAAAAGGDTIDAAMGEAAAALDAD